MKISKLLFAITAILALTSASALADGSVGQNQNVVCAAGASNSAKNASAPDAAPAGLPPGAPGSQSAQK